MMTEDPKKVVEIEVREFERAYDEGERTGGKSYSYDRWVYPLSYTLADLFSRAERDRRPIEMRWVKDLRQVKNEYDPETLGRIHPKRSKAFMGITRTKVKTICARMSDLLFPPSGEKNWSIEPTPVPQLSPELEATIIQKIVEATGVQTPPTHDEVQLILFTEAKTRAEAMEREIADQLAELKYSDIVRNVIRSGNIYGTGVLKGPMVREQKVRRWVPVEGRWTPIEFSYLTPYCEYVDIWDIYPDMTATKPDDLQYVFQRHVMPKNKLQSLADRPDFNGEAIRAYILANPDGDATPKNHEEDLRNLSVRHGDDAVPVSGSDGKYDVLEFWGYIGADDLDQIPGVVVPDELRGLDVAANVWMLGRCIIKAVISRIEGAKIPYHWYYFDKDETCIFGEGIPSLMRDTQKLLNATTRALLDNAAISAGPIIEANKDLLLQGEDPTDLYPFRVFQRQGVGMDASTQAIRVTSLPSYTREYMSLLQLWMTMADETTAVPRYMYGETQNVQGAGRTATGLSMLMGAANIVLKDQIRNFDDGITKPFIRAMYHWNMRLNPKENIKGDFNVQPRGSTSLIAKEVRAEHLNAFLALTNNPVDLALTNRDVILRELAKALDLADLGLIKDPVQVKVEQEQQAAAAEADKSFAKEMATIKATSGGHIRPGASPYAPSGGLPGMERVPHEELQEGRIPEVNTGA